MPTADRKRRPAPQDAGAEVDAPPSGPSPYRMRDLVRLTGLPRETIHFYLTQGLLPKPVKTGRNTALYGPEHLDRLQRIRDLQERHFLPLRAIKAVLEESEDGGFTEAQEEVLRRVRASLGPDRAAVADRRVGVSRLVPSRVSRADLDDLHRLGFIDLRGRGGAATVAAGDAEVLECWAEARALLRDGEGQLTPDLLGIYDRAMESLVDREVRMLSERFPDVPGDRVLELISQSEPVILRLLEALRRRRIAALLDGTGPDSD